MRLSTSVQSGLPKRIVSNVFESFQGGMAKAHRLNFAGVAGHPGELTKSHAADMLGGPVVHACVLMGVADSFVCCGT